jgi:hypothetical protein
MEVIVVAISTLVGFSIGGFAMAIITIRHYKKLIEETIKEFAERLKDRYRLVELSSGCFFPAIIFKDIDNLAKELTEEKQ